MRPLVAIVTFICILTTPSCYKESKNVPPIEDSVQNLIPNYLDVNCDGYLLNFDSGQFNISYNDTSYYSSLLFDGDNGMIQLRFRIMSLNLFRLGNFQIGNSTLDSNGILRDNQSWGYFHLKSDFPSLGIFLADTGTINFSITYFSPSNNHFLRGNFEGSLTDSLNKIHHLSEGNFVFPNLANWYTE
jgi:hypothetical protein